MDYSLYFHIPFCVHRCAYCDFNTYAGQQDSIPAYVDALCREIDFVGGQARAEQSGGVRARTLFFGGGTPSLLTPQQYEKIFRTLQDHFDLSGRSDKSDPPDLSDLPALETSLEANPGTVSLDYLRELRALGFNRISFGVQSFHPDELRQLERIHAPFDAFDAVRWARRAGFENLNLDLIYGLPEQGLDRWSATVKQAVALHPEHLSLYALTLEHGTPFGRWAQRGLLPLPDPDLAAEMYEWSAEYLEAHGYVQYEISNWAWSKGGSGRMQDEVFNPSHVCRHNLTYWRARPYLGFGAGAHGYVAGIRYSNVLRIKTYIERLLPNPLIPPTHHFPLSPAVVNQHKLSRREEMLEMMMLGLRLTRQGVAARDFAGRFDVRMTDAFGEEIETLLGLGLLEWAGREASEVLRLTRRGHLLGNQAFVRFVD